MGLGVTVGVLEAFAGDEDALAHFRKQFTLLETALAEQGRAGYREPERVIRVGRPTVDSFPYSFLHYLRRAYALFVSGKTVTPAADEEALERDAAVVEDEASMLSSHLLCHSDCDGYYVPVQFPDPLFVDEALGVAGGGMVGSTQRLFSELLRVAPAIGVRISADGSLSDSEARRLYDLGDDHPFFREQVVWLTLHEACRDSLATGAAIVFH